MELSFFNKDWKGKVIVLVEDNLSCFRYFSEILKHTGATIVHLETGPEAIEYCCYSVKPADILMVDIQIPLINGVEVIREVKKCRKNLPIIAETAYASPDVKKRSFIAGCHDYLVKPIAPEHLINTLEYYLFPRVKAVDFNV